MKDIAFETLNCKKEEFSLRGNTSSKTESQFTISDDDNSNDMIEVHPDDGLTELYEKAGEIGKT